MSYSIDDLEEHGHDKEENRPSSLTCPKCGVTSWNSIDIERFYCSCCDTFIRDSATFLASMMRPGDERIARTLRYAYVRVLERGDYLGVELLLNHQAALKLCLDDGPNSTECVKDAWHYDQLASAIVAAAFWDPAETQEPFGWYRHPLSGRRRPFGNPTAEYFRQSR